jgi:hypothetical protein
MEFKFQYLKSLSRKVSELGANVMCVNNFEKKTLASRLPSLKILITETVFWVLKFKSIVK